MDHSPRCPSLTCPLPPSLCELLFCTDHEAVKGEWDWSTLSRNLSYFLDLAASEGLFVNLRLGPYVCAEFAHGGLPAYLKAVPDMEFRAYNTAWLNATQYYLEYMRDWLQPHLPKNGGNVILIQVENEYGDTSPNQYIEWLAATGSGSEQGHGCGDVRQQPTQCPSHCHRSAGSIQPLRLRPISRPE